jgi:ribosome biogenesis GTPase
MSLIDAAGSSGLASAATGVQVPTQAAHIGLTDHFLARPACLAVLAPYAAAPPGRYQLLRVTEVQRATLSLHDGRAALEAQRQARLLPALRRRLLAEEDALAVGDWVVAELDAQGDCWAIDRLPPHCQLARRQHDGRDKVTRLVMVANVDTVLLVMGLNQDFNLRRLERYAALVTMAGVPAVVVLSKADLCLAQGITPADRIAQVQARLPALPCLALDGRAGDVPARLAAWLQPGRTLVLLGSSGAGKSTLTNALRAPLPAPEAVGGRDAPVQPTGSTREGDGRGRHTTTARSLHLAVGGACIIDTPGLRTLRLDGDPQALDAVFEEVARLAPLCRYRNCRHGQEPGCVVRTGMDPERLANFLKLEREAENDRRGAAERDARSAQWQAIARARREHSRR